MGLQAKPAKQMPLRQTWSSRIEAYDEIETFKLIEMFKIKMLIYEYANVILLIYIPFIYFTKDIFNINFARAPFAILITV